MKKIAGIALSALLAVGLSGCGSSGSTDKSTADTGKVDKSQTLVVYTNSGGQGRDVALKKMAAKAGYKINVVQIGAADLANRVIAEKNNNQADVIYGLNSLEFEKLKKEDLLSKYTPKWKGDIDSSLADPQGYYWPTDTVPLVLMYNPKMKNVPTDWTDLIKPEYKDKYSLLGLDGGTGKTIYASILARYLDPKGDLGVSKEGWDMVQKIFANGHFESMNEDSVGELISGQRPLCSMWGNGVIQNQNERHYKFGIMSPKIGVPYVTEGLAVVSKSKKQALAKDFINWFGSAQPQLEWSNQYGTIPASKTDADKIKPDIKEFASKVHPQKMDWATISKYIDQWVQKAELKYVKE